MKFLAALTAFSLSLIALPAQAQDIPAPMSAQDLVVMPRLGQPSVTPDGTAVVYAVTATDPESYSRSATLFLRSLATPDAEPVPLDLQGDASGPAFGADGWLYFLSSREGNGPEGVNQVWRASLDAGGRLRALAQVTSAGADVAGFKLSPDASRIAVWGDIARTCPRFGCVETGNTSLPGPGNGRLYDARAGFIRHWDHWETPGNYSRVFAFELVDGAAQGEGIALDGPAEAGVLTGDSPSKPFGGGEEIAWAADSSGLYFAARQADAQEPHSTNLDLWWSDLSGAAPVNLTEGNLATDNLPAASPDGRWLAYAAMARPAYEADRMVVWLRDLATGETRALTQDWDRSVASLAWSPDSRYLLATAQDVLDTPAFLIDPQTGDVRRLDLVEGQEAHIGNLAPLGDYGLVFTRDAIANPPELYFKRDFRGLTRDYAPARRLTDVSGPILADRQPVVTERFSFAGAGGDTVWGQITKLAGQEGPMPAILYVHGGPQGSFDDSWSSRWNPRAIASQGYAVVSIDFHGSTGYGQAFTDSITRDWGGKPLEDLQLGLAAALTRDPQIDGTRACAMGASYGGYMMNWIAGQWPDRFRCLVQHDGVFDQRAMYYETEERWFIEWEHGRKAYFEDPAIYERWNPVNHVDKWQTPMLVITGEKDFRIPYTQGLASFSALQLRGVPAQLLVFPDENHWVLKPKNSLQWHETVFDWLERWLKP